MAEIVGVVVWLASGGTAFAILARWLPSPTDELLRGLFFSCLALGPFMAGVALAGAILDRRKERVDG